MKRALIVVAAACAAVASGIMPANASTGPQVVYNATAAVTGNIPSYGPEAYSFREFGDAVTLAGSARTLNVVTVTMSSWACQSGAWNTHDCATALGAKFTEPITLSIYGSPVTQDDATVVPGALIARVTKSFNIPYRPSANVTHCNSSNGALGKWWNAASSTCFNGKAANISYNFGSLGLDLPDTVVLGVAYNTTHDGYNPVGEAASCFGTPQGCAYDALNIGVTASASVGAQANPGTNFINAASTYMLCDATSVVDEFNLNSPTSACFPGEVPAFKVSAH